MDPKLLERINELARKSKETPLTEEELADFVHIQEELEQISMAVEALQLWSERMLATGAIDPEQYKKVRANLRKEEE